ncbi:MAG: GlxA family transcriptional regulator [Geminicoccaceae bacterium]
MIERAVDLIDHAMAAAPLDIAVLLLPRFSMIALAAVLEPFRIANRLASRTLYRWRFVGPEVGPVAASSGLAVAAEIAVDAMPAAHRAIVCSSFEPLAASSRAVLAWLRALDTKRTELWAVDTGAFVLAEAGLLDGRTVTLHWESLSAFNETYAGIETRRSLFERSGRVATCAGGTAGIDLALQAIAAEHGQRLAFDVADQLIHQRIRDASSPQQVAPMRRYATRNPTVLAAIDLLHASIEQPPSLAEAAAELRVSPRQLQRLFASHLQSSFKRFDRTLRLERAKELLEQTSLPVLAVAVATGFGSVEHFSRSYRALHGRAPSTGRSGGSGRRSSNALSVIQAKQA